MIKLVVHLIELKTKLSLFGGWFINGVDTKWNNRKVFALYFCRDAYVLISTS